MMCTTGAYSNSADNSGLYVDYEGCLHFVVDGPRNAIANQCKASIIYETIMIRARPNLCNQNALKGSQEKRIILYCK